MLTNFTITSKLARLEERDTSRLSQVQPGWTSEVNSSPLEEFLATSVHNTVDEENWRITNRETPMATG